MDRRDQFILLNGKNTNNIDIMLKGDPLPIMSIDIIGLREHRDLAARILSRLEEELPDINFYATQRSTAQRGVLSLKRRRVA